MIVGYEIAIPRTWARIPLRSGTDAVVEEIIRSCLPEHPAHAERVRRTMTRQTLVARDAGGLDLYLPVRGRPLAASFLVAEPSAEPSAEAAAKAPAPGEGTAAVMDGAPAVRREWAARSAAADTRHVAYATTVPGGPRPLRVTFSTAGEPAFTRAVVALFDAMVTTFRWRAP